MFDDKQDLHSGSWYMFIASSGWFATWLDWICNVYVACVTFTCVALRDSKRPERPQVVLWFGQMF